ncbi:MAG: DUF4834 family protein [Prolixibacteraceae bacterium]
MNLFILLYLVNFIRTLIIILVIWFGIRLFRQYVLPILIDKGVKNMQEKMRRQQRQNEHSSRSEGEVTIEKKRKNKKHGSDEGEYVDFEEID